MSLSKQTLVDQLLQKRGIAIKKYPLSYGQKRLWFLDQLEPGSAYNVVRAVRLKGVLDAAALRQSFTELVRRHEVLRTRFRTVDGEPFQEVLPPSTQALDQTDVTAWGPAQRSAEVLRIVQAETNRRFDLAEAGLFVARLVILGPDEHVLVLNTHHIISDGWSTTLMVRELTSLYAAYAQAKPSPLSDLPIQYGDFALWQEQWLSSSRLGSQIEHWKRQLSGNDRLELPCDGSHSASSSGKGSTRNFTLDAPLSVALRDLGFKHNCTLFMVILSAFSALLSRYSEQEDINVGTPVAGRTRTELEQLIGFFVNTLVLRSHVAVGLSVAELLAQARNTVLEAHANQDAPFEMVVDAIKPGRETNQNPLFRVMFVFQNMPQEEVRLPELMARTFPIEKTTTKFDLTLTVMEQGVGITGVMEYRDDLFSGSTIERMIGHLRTLLQAFPANPDQEVVRLPLLSEKERIQLLFEWNQTRMDFSASSCVVQTFEAQVIRRPGAPAVLHEEQVLTYSELNCRANRLAHYLRERGVGPEVRVGMLMEQGPDMLVALLGIVKAGAAYVPLDPAFPDRRIQFILEETQAKACVTQSRLAARLLNTPVLCVELEKDGERVSTYLDENPQSPLLAENLAYVLYTSGSTGLPKGVAVEHRQLRNYVNGILQRIDFTQAATFLLAQPLSVDASVTTIFAALCTGGCLHVVAANDALDPMIMIEYFHRHSIDYLKLAPSHMAALHHFPGAERTVIPGRILVLGGEALRWEEAQRLRNILGEACVFHNQYGPTESTVGVLTYQVDASEGRHGSITPLGRPLPNVEIYILDLLGKPVPIGGRGELYVGGEGLARGYINRPEWTAEKFVPDPFSSKAGARLYRTGDQARYLANGNIEFLGRSDEQIKVRGHRVECMEIEAALMQHPDVSAAAFVVRKPEANKDDDSESCLIAYVVARGTQEPQAAILRQHLLQCLPDYMVPSVFMTVEALPRTSHGKLNRKALPMPNTKELVIGPGYAYSQTETERQLAKIFSELLNLPTIGIYDNFFNMGGHSLLATRVLARVRSEMQVTLPLRALFDAPTVAGLAGCVAKLQQGRSTTPSPNQIVRKKQLPLSYAQQRLWFLHQLEPDSVAYNMPIRLQIEGKLAPEALQASFDELVMRHESLRTRFVMQREGEIEEPMQVIVPKLKPRIETVDLRGLVGLEREREAEKHARLVTNTPFDLSEGPLLRVMLFRMKDEEHVLVINLHHIVCDGWSLRIIVREIGQLYHLCLQKKTMKLPEMPMQYGDYAVWQRTWLQGEGHALEEQLSYWRKKLNGLIVLELPTARPRSMAKSDAGAALQLRLGAELGGRLRLLAQKEEVTLFMTLLGAFQALLSRYSGQKDVAVGTPIAGRRFAELEGVIGFFVNTLVMRTDLSGRPGFREVLRRVRESALEAFANQDVPFEKLVEDLHPERERGRSPLFQVMFMLQNLPEAQLELAGLKLREQPFLSHTEKFELTMAAMEEEGGSIWLNLNYRKELFHEGSMWKMLRHFEMLLEEMVSDPGKSISDLEMLDTAERRQLLQEYGNSESAYLQGNLHEAFAEQAAMTPDAIAVKYGEQWLSYAELNRRSNQLGHYLRKLGARSETLVGLCMERSLEMLVGILGVLKAGAAYVPLDPDYPVDRLAYMLQNTRAEILLVQERFRPLVSSGESPAINVLALDSEWKKLESESCANLNVKVDPANPVYVIFTSGSTGRPKGVMVTHGSLHNHMQWMSERFAFNADDRVLQKTAFSFDASVWEFYAPLLAGGCLVFARPGGQRDPDYLLQCIAEEGITVLQLVPTQLQMLVEIEGLENCENLARVYCGGETLSMELVRSLKQRAPWVKLYNLYGPTEATIDAVFEECSFTEHEAAEYGGTALIGRPIANVRALVLDDAFQLVPQGAWGELYLGGEGLARGYVHRSELTAERFVPDPFSEAPGKRLYRTGDVVRWNEAGRLEFLGRRDHQVKVRGFRIELSEIEAALDRHENVSQSIVVMTTNGEKSGPQLIAYVQRVKGGAGASSAELRRYLQGKLPEYMVPAAIVVLDRLPLTPNGKVDKKNLPAPDEAEETERDDATRTVAEDMLCGLWRELLNRKHVRLQDNFFTLGGHSLLATQLIARIRRTFGVDLPLRTLFDAPTVAQLAERIAEQDDKLGRPLPEVRITNRAPRTPGEKVLCTIFAELLHLENLGIDDNFFDLGGQSLLAVRLKEQIKQRTGQELSLAAISQQSIESLAVFLDGQQADFSRTPIIEMKKGTSKLPLFFIHGAGGSAFIFDDLARHLHPDAGFIVLQDLGLDRGKDSANKDIAGDGTDPSSITAMADEYCHAIRRMQPTGPYLLGGWSLGGVIAFEMARQLQESGEKIGLLALIDSFLPTANGQDDYESIGSRFLLNAGFTTDDLKKMIVPGLQRTTFQEKLVAALQIGVDSGVFPRGMTLETLERLYRTYRRHVLAGKHFKPHFLSAATHLWRALDNSSYSPQQESEWRQYVGELHATGLPGTHFTLLRPPHVAALAYQLSNCIREANGKGQKTLKGSRTASSL